MKLSLAICLWIATACSPIAAQQLLASGNSKPANLFPQPAIAVTYQPSAPGSTLADWFAVSSLPLSSSLYEAALTSAAVCTQPVPPAVASPAAYAFDRSQFTAAALRAALTHDNMVKMAHDFMPGQPLPDAPTYKPFSARQKFDAFVRNSHSVTIATGILSGAVISQVTGAYPRLDGGMAGFGQRLGITAAGAEGAAFIGGFLYPTLFHQDPRYFPSHENGILNRIAYAASRAIIGRSDNGFGVINTSVIASQFTEAAIANAYVPYRNRSFSGTAENALTGLGGVAEGDILNEFWPDIEQFAWRHTHSKLLRWGMELGQPVNEKIYRFDGN